jgi:hypothetical protein
MKVLGEEESDDPCTTNIQFEHAAGCVVYSFTPLIRVAGVVLLVAGWMLAKMTNKNHGSDESKKLLLSRVVQVLNFITLMSLFYIKGWFDGIDPTSNIDFSIEAIMLSVGVTMSVVFIGIGFAKIFTSFINLGPAILGAILSYFITVYLLLIAQGLTDFFSDSDKEDALSAKASIIISVVGIIMGIYIGMKLGIYMIYLTSAFVSSYLIVRGVSLWVGNFMSEPDMVKGIFTDEDIPPISSCMMTYSLVIFVIWLHIIFLTIRKQTK